MSIPVHTTPRWIAGAAFSSEGDRAGARGAGSRPVHTFAALAWIAAHAPLALLMKQSPGLATAHTLLVLALGLVWGASGSVARVAHLGAYIAGSDVLWRMCGSQVAWEAGKYTLSLIFLIALLRTAVTRPPLLMILYLVLLLPSASATLQRPDSSDIRGDLSFNLSGPLSLTMASWFYSRLGMAREDVLRLLVVLLGPVAGIAAIAAFGVATAAKLRFTTESNFASSGGFGPNQVSALLGLGTLAATLVCVLRTGRRPLGVAMAAMAADFAAQSALTFSRTGVYCAGAGIATAAATLCRDGRSRVHLALAAALIAGLSWGVIVPALDAFTGGTLARRFAEKSYSGRDELLGKDVETFLENPLLGVGPGGSKEHHRLKGHVDVATHSEITRLLAEHGGPGAVCVAILGFTAIRNFARQPSAWGRCVAAALLTWSLLILFSNAMRYAAPSLAFGLCFATFLPTPVEETYA